MSFLPCLYWKKLHQRLVKGLKRIAHFFMNNFYPITAHINRLHLNVGKLNSELYCKFCKKEFPTERAALLHRKRVHESEPERKVKCKICKKLIKQTYLSKHMKTIHSKERLDIGVILKTISFVVDFHVESFEILKGDVCL